MVEPRSADNEPHFELPKPQSEEAGQFDGNRVQEQTPEQQAQGEAGKTELPAASSQQPPVANEPPQDAPPLPPVPVNDDEDQTALVPIPTADETPAIADDADLIEKEWVNKAKAIVDKTRNDPHLQTKEMNKVKADYIKKRYGKELKTDES